MLVMKCSDFNTQLEIKRPLIRIYLKAAYLFAVWTGLEPATSCVTGRHSNQLNYQTNPNRQLLQRLSRPKAGHSNQLNYQTNPNRQLLQRLSRLKAGHSNQLNYQTNTFYFKPTTSATFPPESGTF